MERVISLFKRPEDFEFEAADENYPWIEPKALWEPEYFEQIMQYLRERKEDPARQGAD